MCTEPVKSPHGLVACRKCKRCRNNRINDWVGRCIAEQKVSKDAFALSLTYSDDILEAEEKRTGQPRRAAAETLVYADVQKLMKRIRKSGCRVRHFVCGEYGSKKGRAHWHLAIFLKEGDLQLPPVETDRQMWRFWPHGYTYVQRPDHGGWRYVCKYLLKDDQRLGTRSLRMSKGRATVAGNVNAADDGPIGWQWFKQLADETARQGLPLNDWCYTHPEAVYRNGKPVQFWLQGRTRELFEREYRIAWTRYRRTPLPYCPAFERANDNERRRRQDNERAIRKDRAAIQRRLAEYGRQPEKGWTSKCRTFFLYRDISAKWWVSPMENHNLWRVELRTIGEILAAYHGRVLPIRQAWDGNPSPDLARDPLAVRPTQGPWLRSGKISDVPF